MGDDAATYVFRNGRVYTVDPARAWATAVAVHGDTIGYVGDDAGAARFVGAATEVIDLDGAMLLPGFVQGHIHCVAGAAMTRGAQLRQPTREATLAAIERYVRSLPDDGSVVRGFGWRSDHFPTTGPVKDDLDAIAPDRPVLLFGLDGRRLWVNSTALKLAGVGPDTPDPAAGSSYFERDSETGEATGQVVGVPAQLLVLNRVQPMDEAFIATALAQCLPQAAAAGITSLFDAGMVLLPDQARGFDLLLDLAEDGDLPVRVVGGYYQHNPAEDPLPKLRDLRERFDTGLVRAGVLRLDLDGDSAGDASHYTDLVIQADAEHIDLHIRVTGDRGVRIILDALEQAGRANPGWDRRHTLSHLDNVDPVDIPRFAELGAIAEFSISSAGFDPYREKITTARLGPQFFAHRYPARSILQAGGRVTFGSDWPAAGYHSSYRPLEAIEVAITRRAPGRRDQQPTGTAEQRFTLGEAIRAHTIDAAYQLRLDDRIGSITPGKLADLVVLGDNVFDLEPTSIHRVPVLATMMNGRLHHRTRETA